jgi:benzoylformate decarboxylase
MVEYLGKAARGRQFVAMDPTDPELRFDRMVESMGVWGWRVEKPEDLAPTLKEAIARNVLSLVDVVIENPVPIP